MRAAQGHVGANPQGRVKSVGRLSGHRVKTYADSGPMQRKLRRPEWLANEQDPRSTPCEGRHRCC